MSTSIADSVERLQGLQRDLCSLTATTLPNIDRLSSELETRVDEFRALLDKPPKNEQSRRNLSSDTLKFKEHEYTTSEPFRQQAIQIAEALDLDEIEAAKILVAAEYTASSIDRTPLATAIILFHQERQYRLECLRLSLEKAYGDDEDVQEDVVSFFRRLALLVVQDNSTSAGKGQTYWRKCLAAMNTLETTLQHITERVQSVAITDQTESVEFAEIMSFQSSSISRQHECVGIIMYWLAKGNQANSDDLKALLAKSKGIERYDSILTHYIPSLFALLSTCASSEGECSLGDAENLQHIIASTKEPDIWSLRPFQAAASAVWLASYSSRFMEVASQSSASSLQNRTDLFTAALRDGAFQFMLAVGQDIREKDWYDPARQGLAQYLLQDTPMLQSESFIIDESLQSIIMERLQTFADSYITFMPDSLRQLKHEEDNHRRQMQPHLQTRPSDQELQLARFLSIISHAFQGYPVASEAFWDDPDGNLYGFLQWSSQRQPTPRVPAFCEMLCALSAGDICANAAHRFLLDETNSTSSRSRRNSPLSWSHIFRELEFYANSIKDRPVQASGLNTRKDGYSESVVEPESVMMLESYLRLVAHLARESPEARGWLLTRTAFSVVDHLLLLSASGIESRLRACAFNALSGLLTQKNAATHSNIWQAIDAWLYGQTQSVHALTPRAPHIRTSEGYEKVMFEQLSVRFEEPNTFVSLLMSLLASCEGDDNFSHSLPFPEDLGARYRMAGIDSYVDFVMDLVFARKSDELQDPVQLRIMRWNCLSFAHLCLFSFNEDLLILATKSKIAIDNAIDTSSLASYARIHPFARMMEWLFNDSVIAALFATAMQDIQGVNAALEGSPLVLGLLKSIEVIDLVLDLQRTYFDVVRPIVKTQSHARREPVANSALASFEDALVNHLELVPLLGLYAGSGHEQIAIASLKLLQKLAQQPKLSTPLHGSNHRRFEKSRLIAALERDSQNYTISQCLAGSMNYDSREIESGPECPGVMVKTGIVQFLKASINAIENRPSIGHLLLGFTCSSHTIFVEDDGPFATSTSLFHSILSFVIGAPDGQRGSLLTWLLQIKNDALKVLQTLWRAPVSVQLTLSELRLHDFMCSLSLQQSTMQPNRLIDFKSFDDPEFLLSDAAIGFASFLELRGAFLEYAATELLSAHESNLDSLKARLQNSLLGTTVLLDGQEYSNPTIFDYLDFLDIDFGSHFVSVESRYFDMSTFACCQNMSDDSIGPMYDIPRVQQLLQLQQQELRKSGQLSEPSSQQQVEADSQNFLQCFIANNQRSKIVQARSQLLTSWVQLATVMVACGNMNAEQQSAFILQLLQHILPQLERSYADDQEVALTLAKFCQTLLMSINRLDALEDARRPNSHTEDRLFDVFATALLGVQVPEATDALRATCAHTCQGYLHSISQASEKVSSRAIDSVKSTGDRLMETLCEDAYAGEGDCKVAAMTLLDAIMSCGNERQSRYVLDAFDRFNFIQALTGALKSLPFELRAAEGDNVSLLLSFYDSSLSLLLRVSQTRPGAACVFNAGLFSAVRDSGIFTADPDIGLDTDNPQALAKYYGLMLAIIRVINAILLSRGAQNDQTIAQARLFLREYRPTIVAVYKRVAKIGSIDEENEDVLGAIVENLTVLIGASGFLESEGEQIITAEGPRLFT